VHFADDGDRCIYLHYSCVGVGVGVGMGMGMGVGVGVGVGVCA